jgi:hypothetical protein
MTYTAATVRGTIIDLGMSAVTEHGIVWSTSANPTTADSKAVDAGPQAIGQFAEDAIALTTGTTYYVRAYATNTQGTGYGDNIEFVAGTPPAGTYFNPADQFTRVSGIVRRWYPGLGGLAVYEAVLLLGGTSITYIPPIGNRETPSSAAPETLPSGQDFSLSNFNKYIDNLKSKMPVNTDNMTALRPLPTYSAWVKWAASLIRQGNK